MASESAAQTMSQDVQSTTNPAMSGLQTVYAVLGARDFGVALVAGAGAMFILGQDGPSSVQFGAVAALANSMGDAAATSMQLQTKISAYDPQSAYFDMTDLLAGGLMSGALFYYLGASGTTLYYSAAIGAVAAGVGGKVSAKILSMASP